MELRKFIKKEVKIIDIDDIEWLGTVDSLEYGIDNEQEDILSLKRNGYSGLVDFPKSEIKSIEKVAN